MPIPHWVAQINKRVLNKREIASGTRPVLTHTGRSSGTKYQTPLEVHPIDGGYIFFLLYGSGSDWVQNVLASGSASLRIGDDEYELQSPRLVNRYIARELLGADAKIPSGLMRAKEFLQMDVRSA